MVINEIEQQIDAILNESAPVRPHADHLVTDKIIYPKSVHFGKKGESYMLYNGGDEQWYFRPKNEEEFIRVKWFFLDSNVSEGTYGRAVYTGINPAIYNRVGELTYTNKRWLFVVTDADGEVDKFQLVNPESVRMFDA